MKFLRVSLARVLQYLTMKPIKWNWYEEKKIQLCDFTNDAVYIIYEYVYESLIGFDNEQE